MKHPVLPSSRSPRHAPLASCHSSDFHVVPPGGCQVLETTDIARRSQISRGITAPVAITAVTIWRLTWENYARLIRRRRRLHSSRRRETPSETCTSYEKTHSAARPANEPEEENANARVNGEEERRERTNHSRTRHGLHWGGLAMRLQELSAL